MDEWRFGSEHMDLFPVLPENWPAVELFVACSSQWRYAGMAGFPAGLDFAGVKAVADAFAAPLDRAMVERLRTMEAAAVEAFSERWGKG